ncbi:unnamed protein product [Penicillium nalgiovense]|uniref:DUF6536 domain-containing protein n=1 Tax=Penicillium nalgiovense TaxID=60175 RepID=A0A9W4HW92_PENNA|nr:unnamed protein product [Penicillium nalgiovense]CAG7949026.1 unnamed protein product [Penicillium nalgiovense]CAG7949094.1 unnamed protein product [Penicillium nalgiovense]CAG7979499.1 unnamed protein product [Penicillium nalgiovense]CAG7989945.1 unnamed protein product [Penicillium nalgiovense]
MEDRNLGSSKYACKSVSSLGSYSTIYTGLIVDAVLDSSILKGKLTELVGLWPILGGDLIRDTKPWSFTCGSTVDYASRAIDQPLATHLPIHHEQHSKDPSIMESPELSAVDEKFIFNVSPSPVNSFRLRVTLLQNATLLCFGISHHICDGNDCWEVVKAFCDLLSNRPIPSFALPPDTRGVRMSDLVKVKNECSEAESNFHYQTHAQHYDNRIFNLAMTAWRVLLTILAVKFGFLAELAAKFIYIPGAWVDELRVKSQAELKDCYPEIQLTRNDVIAAWYLKSVYSPQPTTMSSDPVDYFGIINLRRFIEPPKSGTYYIRCSIGAFRCFFSVHQLKEESVAEIARNIRLATLQYTSTESVRQGLRFSEDHASKSLTLALRGTISLGVAVVSHWTTFDYAGLDFSGASLHGKKASVIFVNPMIVNNWHLTIAPVAIVTKNGSEGYWIRATNTSTGWERFGQSNSMESTCHQANQITTGLHILVNTILLTLTATSSYCNQVLAASSLARIDIAHAQRVWVSIVSSSFMNVCVGCERAQAVITIVYAVYNNTLTQMLLAAEYDDFGIERKPLRV